MKSVLIFVALAGATLAAVWWLATPCKPGYPTLRIGNVHLAGCK